MQISAGLDHVVAVNEDGQIFTWGNDRMGLSNIPMDLRTGGNNIKQILAGHQISLALTEEGKMYNWGSEYLLRITYPEGVQGNIDKFAASTNIVMVLTKDGEVVPLTTKTSAYTNIPEEIQGNVIDLAITDESAAAVTSDGRVYTWGNNIKKSLNVPEEIQGQCDRHLRRPLSLHRHPPGRQRGVLGRQHPRPGLRSLQRPPLWPPWMPATTPTTPSRRTATWCPGGLKGYLMGTDAFGRDLFRRILVGGRMTMTVGAISVIISTIIGIIVGGVSGYKGGKVDNLLMRLTEIVSSIPFLPFCIILSSILGNSISETQRIILIMCILGLLSWPGIARLVRGSVLAEREQEFVTAAKSLGRQGVRHHLPAHPAQYHHCHHCQRHPELRHLYADGVLPCPSSASASTSPTPPGATCSPAPRTVRSSRTTGGAGCSRP